VEITTEVVEVGGLVVVVAAVVVGVVGGLLVAVDDDPACAVLFSATMENPYNASSRSALLAALEGCIDGHESLLKAGILHRDISINNLMINEDNDDSSWPSFLIDLDLAIRVERDGISGAKGKTGTRAFMAIGALLGEQHSFMHDLESFFWVLFWICIHCDGPGKGKVVAQFDKWNYADTEELAQLKKGQISDEGGFIKAAEKNFTPYYKPVVPWVNKLRKVVFPSGRRWEREDSGLYSRMRGLLEEARKDPKVSAEGYRCEFADHCAA